MVPTTGSTFPSSRHDSVSVSSIFPLSQCPERLNTNAFIVGTTTDVRRMTSPAWAHPRAREREKGRKRWRQREKERERERIFLLSLFASVFSFLSSPFLFLYPREFHSSGFCGPSLSPLSLSFLAFARACRKTPNRSVTQRQGVTAKQYRKKGNNKISRSSMLATDRKDL